MSAASNKSRPTRLLGNFGSEDPECTRKVTNAMVSPDYEDCSVEESDSTLDHYESPIMDLMETDDFSVRAIGHRSASPGGGIGAGDGGDEKAHNGSEPHLEGGFTKQAGHSGNKHGSNIPLKTLTNAEWNDLISVSGENDFDQLPNHCKSGLFIDSTHDKRIKSTLDKVHDGLKRRESSLNDTKEGSDVAILAELTSRVEHLCKSRVLTAEKHTEELAAKDQHIDDLVKLQERLLRENQILQEKCESLVEEDQRIEEVVKLQECLLHKNEIRWRVSELQKKSQRRDIKRLNKRIGMYRHETDKLIKENDHCAQIYSELQQKSYPSTWA